MVLVLVGTYVFLVGNRYKLRVKCKCLCRIRFVGLRFFIDIIFIFYFYGEIFVFCIYRRDMGIDKYIYL